MKQAEAQLEMKRMEPPKKEPESSLRGSDAKQIAESLKSVGEAIAASAKPRTRKGKMKAPSGKVYEMEINEG